MMDFCDEAVDCVERAEAAAFSPVPGQTLFLAVYITRKGCIRMRPAHSAADARMQLPDKIYQQGLWLIIRKSFFRWVVSEKQFSCLSARALRQFVDYAGERWLKELDAAKRRHPSFAEAALSS